MQKVCNFAKSKSLYSSMFLKNYQYITAFCSEHFTLHALLNCTLKLSI